MFTAYQIELNKPKCGNKMDDEYDLPHSDTT
jgi:hypothetical protein